MAAKKIDVAGVTPTTKLADLTVSQFGELLNQASRQLATSNSLTEGKVTPELPGFSAINNLVRLTQRNTLDGIAKVADQIASVAGVPAQDVKKIQDAIAQIRKIMAEPAVVAAINDLTGGTQQRMLEVVPQIVRETGRSAKDAGRSPFAKGR